MNIPTGHQPLMPYLLLNGVSDFIQFTQTVFGATESMRRMRDENTIMHAEIKIGDNTLMMADSTEEWSVQAASLFIYVTDADATYQKALETGAESIMEMSTEDYGRTGGFKDPFGNTWWVTSVKD